MFDRLRRLFNKKSESESNSDEVISDNLLNNEYNEGKYIPFYDHYHDVWAVKDTADDVYYPMTGKNMAYEITILLNNYDSRLHNVLDELFKKDRKFEELGYDLDKLDEELGI